MKKCARCHIDKPTSEYWRQKKSSDGLGSYCKQCCREKHTEYRRKRGVPVKKKKDEYILPDRKVCSRCHVEKPKLEFRIRFERRSKPPFPYLNNNCKQCEAKITQLTYREWRKTPEGRKMNNARAKTSYNKRREKIKAQMKAKRQTPEYKKMMKEYRLRNKDKIALQEVVTKRRYQNKHKSGITDKYVMQQLRQEGNHKPTPEQIEIKRAKILIHRIKENIDSQMIGVSKVCSVCKEAYDLSQFWRTAKNSKKRVSYCRSCGSAKNREQKNKRNERHS